VKNSRAFLIANQRESSEVAIQKAKLRLEQEDKERLEKSKIVKPDPFRLYPHASSEEKARAIEQLLSQHDLDALNHSDINTKIIKHLKSKQDAS